MEVSSLTNLNLTGKVTHLFDSKQTCRLYHTVEHFFVNMDCEATRILQVSLSKITDSRRRRGGPVLRRNLLVSHVLNNVLTSTDSAYCTYRSKVEIDMDIDAVENELVPFEKSKMTPNNPGGPDAGNARHTVRSAAKSNGKVSEMEHSMLSIDRKESVELVNSANALKGGKECDKAMKPELKCVSGSKRPRSSAYVNEPCDSHAVDNKRLKTERNEQPKTELSYQEPMDISGLVNVFSSSFSGLSSIPRATPSLGSKLDSFQYLSPRVRPVGGVFGWSQTIVEAF